MAKRLRYSSLVACGLLMLAATGEAAEARPQWARPRADSFSSTERTNRFSRGQMNDGWAVWIEERLMGSPDRRVQKTEEKLYRRGPTNAAPHLLLVSRNPPGTRFWLGSNGLLVVESFVYFPGKNEPHLLEAPRPAKTNLNYRPPYWRLDRCWFFGDVLAYESRSYGGAEYLVGLFQVDRANEKVSTNRICLEVNDTNDALVRAAQVAGDRIFLMGTYLLWENTGWNNDIYPDEVQGTWKTRKLRAFDLESGRLLTGTEILLAVLARHKDAVARAFGPLKFR